MIPRFKKRFFPGAFLLFALALQALPSLLAKAHSASPPADSSRENYAGDEACRPCHASKIETYLATAHHRTSQLPSKESILGSFADDKNIMRTSNPSLYFRMESKPDGFYQTAFYQKPGSAAPPVVLSHSEKIGVVIGSGKVGQTYLYWKGDQLFQLPISYWTELASWINSPGYRDGTADFHEGVIPNCLGCHITYAASIGSPMFSHEYKPESFVFGISCERCHGPGRAHVEAMAAKKSALSLLKLAELPRDRQMDVCAQCHGGVRTPLSSPFSYVPGESLDKYFLPDSSKPGQAVDVHGNQVALLQMSRCYQSSANLTCTTCHDVHQTQRDAAAFSKFCLQCHRASACGEFPKLKEKIMSNCVDCHMPVLASNVIFSTSDGKQVRAKVRSHWIKIYSDLGRDSGPRIR